MILGDPPFRASLSTSSKKAAPAVGKNRGLSVNGLSEIILQRWGHVIDAKPWIDQSSRDSPS